MQSMIAVSLNLLSYMFGLSFYVVKDDENIVWHPDVEVIAIHEDPSHGSDFLGYLYLDFYCRDGKFQSASCFNLQPVSTHQYIYLFT